VLQGRTAVAARDQGLHQPQRHLTIVRIHCGELSPPNNCGPGFSPNRSGSGQLLECAGILILKRGSLYLNPALEFRCFWHVEAVEEWSGIAGNSSIQLAGLNGPLKVDSVTGHHVGIETDLVTAQKQVFFTQVTAERVERLGQYSTRLLRLAFRPQKTEDLVAGEPPVSCPIQQSKQGKPSPLSPRPLCGTLAALDG